MDTNNDLPLVIPRQLNERLLDYDLDPNGAYGVSYGVYTQKTLPRGWNARRGESAYTYVYYCYKFTLLQQLPISSVPES